MPTNIHQSTAFCGSRFHYHQWGCFRQVTYCPQQIKRNKWKTVFLVLIQKVWQRPTAPPHQTSALYVQRTCDDTLKDCMWSSYNKYNKYKQMETYGNHCETSFWGFWFMKPHVSGVKNLEILELLAFGKKSPQFSHISPSSGGKKVTFFLKWMDIFSRNHISMGLGWKYKPWTIPKENGRWMGCAI